MYRLKGGKWSTIHDCNSDIAPWTSYDTLGSKFCILLEVVLLYPLTVKSILFVRCYEQQATFCLHDIISGQNGRRGKTEHQRIVCFSILYQVIRSLLSSLLNSQFAGGNQQVMSAFQHEMTTVLVLVTSDATWFFVHAYKWQYRISFCTIRLAITYTFSQCNHCFFCWLHSSPLPCAYKYTVYLFCNDCRCMYSWQCVCLQNTHTHWLVVAYLSFSNNHCNLVWC